MREATRYVWRGVRGPGSERDDLVLGVKTVAAAMTAWVLARYLLLPTVSTFAPFTALVALQATVYRSLRDCAQHLFAMTAGAALAATLAATLAAAIGIHWWSFGLLTLLALAVGRLRPLGAHGTQVAIVGFFAFSAGQGQIDYIGHLVASVGIGVTCGIAAHLALAPARHTLHRQEAVADLFTGIERRLGDLAGAFATDAPDADRIQQLRTDWRALSADADRIRQAIDSEVENSRLNPRSSIEDAHQALMRARAALDVAQRCMGHLRSTSRSLDYGVSSGAYKALSPTFRAAYTALLRTAATALDDIGRRARTDPAGLRETLEHAHADVEHAQKQTSDSPHREAAVSALEGTLLTDASRLLEDLDHGFRRIEHPA
ncbi:aromatic acid exporter family protein [Streptomyces sp. H27-H1]|uniref:aromatic acid exporter family protein n=1 Tax=Streptomyces sp. H27-H1 TaxID=2996461 RepID=UPI002271269C|nr:aromatic acid exporter family protein [Streptomyces sp. H27-H1]MCY0932247.1 aromatic acid exporter family protein [Streptomyces sp. H27-H1]